MSKNGKGMGIYKIEWQGVPLNIYMKNFKIWVPTLISFDIDARARYWIGFFLLLGRE